MPGQGGCFGKFINRKLSPSILSKAINDLAHPHEITFISLIKCSLIVLLNYEKKKKTMYIIEEEAKVGG